MNRWTTLSASEIAAKSARNRAAFLGRIAPVLAAPKEQKYKNKAVVHHNERFDSGRERNRYRELLLLQAAGKISGLVRQLRFELDVAGIHICEYVADFCYVETGAADITVEDVKPKFKNDASKAKYHATQAYRTFIFKKRLMLAVHGHDVVEV